MSKSLILTLTFFGLVVLAVVLVSFPQLRSLASSGETVQVVREGGHAYALVPIESSWCSMSLDDRWNPKAIRDKNDEVISVSYPAYNNSTQEASDEKVSIVSGMEKLNEYGDETFYLPADIDRVRFTDHGIGIKDIDVSQEQ